MNIIYPEELKILASLFTLNNTPLYIVGGYVRNAILKIYNTDIDLASACTAEEVCAMLQNTPFKARLENKKLGTLKIFSADKKFECEYTAFRLETYSEGGEHTPSKVSFKADIGKDAQRRDFTCNALYYDIQNDSVIDFFNGCKHIQNKTIKAINDRVFESDGLRILRLIRQSAELNFKIDKHTFELALKCADKLKDISAERIRKELELMLFADKKYGVGNYMTAITELRKLNIQKYVLKTDKKLNFKHLKICLENARLPALIIDMGLKGDSVRMFMGEKGLKFPNTDINKTRLAVEAFYDLQTVKSAYEIRRFIQKYNQVIDIVLGLKYKDKQIKREYDYMKTKNIPFSVADLKVKALELMDFFPELPPYKMGDVLDGLLSYTAKNPSMNSKNLLLNKVKKDLKEE